MKFIIPIFLGALISFALFAVMASLVATEEVYIEEVDESPIIKIISLPRDTQVAQRKRNLEPPPEPKHKPVGQIKMTELESNTVITPSDIDLPNIEIDSNLADQEFTVGVIKDSDAMPIYRSLPRYPLAAAREKIKGWVKLSFSINRFGKVENIAVIDSEPKVIFDQAAIDALQHWKYKAKLENGKTVRQEYLSVRIDFGNK
ncbi:energy transducer TonB [Thalassotalea nanhaiensis]|uniref:Protein TonB n=1 Tax=Thalassotalea nanhaiensis TaxID=3065648 RepID=A0ABY9TM29_9GAMM|nr:energy transducer TonB [Colwelliaceae bacterium SQ345]